MADHMRTSLVADALRMAAGARGGATAGIVFHGDRGNTSRVSTANSSMISAWPSRSAVPACVGTTAWPRRPISRPGRGPPGDLRLDQPLQPAPAPVEPRLPATR
jgi:hypothetical protein